MDSASLCNNHIASQPNNPCRWIFLEQVHISSLCYAPQYQDLSIKKEQKRREVREKGKKLALEIFLLRETFGRTSRCGSHHSKITTCTYYSDNQCVWSSFISLKNINHPTKANLQSLIRFNLPNSSKTVQFTTVWSSFNCLKNMFDLIVKIDMFEILKLRLVNLNISIPWDHC